MRYLVILIVVMNILSCKLNHSPSEKASLNQPTNSSAKNLVALSGTYKLDFKDVQHNCTLNLEPIDEDFVYQIDQESLQSEFLQCKISLNKDIFCGEDLNKILWTGVISGQGKAKLSAKPSITQDLQQSILAELPTQTAKDKIVVDYALFLNFIADQEQGYIELKYQFPSELKNVACNIQLPFDFTVVGQDKL